MGSSRSWRSRCSVAAALAMCATAVAACGGSGGSDSSGDGSGGTSTTASVGVVETPSAWASDVAAQPSPGCESAPADAPPPGLTEETFAHDDTEREYSRLVPETEGDRPIPLLVDLHGLGSNKDQQRNLSGYEDLAAQDGVAVVWPQGLGERPGWSTASGEANRDVAFIVDLVAATGEELCIDEARVYASGMSNGGLMSSALACEHGDVFAAVAPVAGFQTVADCADPSSLLLFYGTHDAVLPYAGGVGSALGAAGGDEVPDIPEPEKPDLTADPGPFAPVPVNIAEWASLAGCEPEQTTESVSDEVDRWVYEGCATGDVEIYLVDGGGHTWPGSETMATMDDPVVAAIIGHTTLDISATDLAWEFFAEHPQEA